RTNYRGREVSLAGGSGAVAGALAGVLLEPPGYRGAALLAGGAAAVAGGHAGLLAPRAPAARRKGLPGPPAAGRARAGRGRAGGVSGGAVKVAVIGGAALVAAGRLDRAGGGPSGGLVDRALRAAVIAGSANLLNLLDLRPGRAGKVAAAAGLLGATGPAAGVSAAGAGAAAGVLPSDLGERPMLRDLRADTLGPVSGVRLAAGSVPTRMAALAVIASITAISERVSLSKVIDNTPALRRIDQLGRAPAP